MPLFRCVRCGCVENTALSLHYEHLDDKQYLCSECDPGIGRWHGAFEKASAEGWFYDSSHYIYSQDDVDQAKREWRYNRNFKMVGRVVDGKLSPFKRP